MKLNRFISIMAGLYIVTLLVGGCANKDKISTNEGNEAKPSEIVHLPAAVVKEKNVSRQIVISGIVSARPDHSVKVSPALVGKLVNVFVVPGQPVKCGQIIAKLDDRHVHDQLEQAKAAVDLAQANVIQAQNNLNFATDNLQRQQKLFGAEVSAKKDVVAAENQLNTAQSQLSATQSQLKSAQANYKQIKTELDFTEIHSPINGVVANRYLNVGDTADLNTPIVQVVDLATVIINATLPADTPEKIKTGQHTKVTSEADPTTEFGGTVISVSPVVDTQSNSIRIQVRCLNYQNELREGQTVSVSVIGGTDKRALLLPQTALVPDPDKPDQSMVYIIKDGKAKRAAVTIGVVEDKQVEIVKGLNNGDLVIIQGAYGLPEGTEIQPEIGSTNQPEKR
jgi:RND family efflux transporter MFP subunit